MAGATCVRVGITLGVGATRALLLIEDGNPCERWEWLEKVDSEILLRCDGLIGARRKPSPHFSPSKRELNAPLRVSWSQTPKEGPERCKQSVAESSYHFTR